MVLYMSTEHGTVMALKISSECYQKVLPSEWLCSLS